MGLREWFHPFYINQIIMNIKIYRDRLRRHDWFYQMSHDSRRYDSGKEEEDNLKKLAEGRKTYKAAYERQYRKMFPKK